MLKKTMILSVALLFACFSAFAQKGNNQVNIGLDAGLPMGDFGESSNLGIGGTVKGMYGIGDAGQLELTLGYIGFGSKGKSDFVKASSGLIPILVGYRHHLNGFYLEPQLGLTMIKSKVKSKGGEAGGETYGGGSYSSSTTAFGWALGVGYLFDDFDVSVRYQSASKNGGSLGFFGLRLGYNFSLGK